MENWTTEIGVLIDKSLENVKEKDKRFFRVDEFKRNIKRTGELSEECSFCRNMKDEIVHTVVNLAEAIQVPGKKRREYDRLIADLTKHMRKVHGFYPPYYYSYLFAFWGLIAGGISGFLLSYLVASSEVSYSIGFAAGIVTAYVFGSLKDSKIRAAGKFL